MKSKILLFSILSLFIFSCNSDDENSGGSPIPSDQKYLSKITDDQGTTVATIEYNSDKTIKKKVLESVQVRYEYDTNGRVSKSYISFSGAPTITTDFEHDANGNILGYTQNDLEYEVEKTGNKYLFVNNDDAYEVDVNSNHEIIKFQTGDAQLDFLLADGKSGSLSNTNNVAIYDFIANPFYYFYFSSMNNLTHQPIEDIYGALGAIAFENEYDEDGFLKRAVLNSNAGDEPVTLYI